MPLCLFSTILYLHFFLIFIYLYRNAILYLRYSMQGFLRWLTHTTMNILFGQGKRRWRDFFFGSAFDRYHGHGDKGNLAQRSQEMKRTYNFAVCSTVNRYVQNEEQDTWVNKYSMQIINIYIYIYIPCYIMAHLMSSGCRLAIIIYFYFIF